MALIWTMLALVAVVPLVLATISPLLAWREPIYIVAGFAGIIAMVLMSFQPLLAMGSVPGIERTKGRHMHRLVGFALVLLVIVHVGALWMTSPPDVVDALLFVSPTPFSLWGVIAMWAVFASAALAVLRYRLRWRVWRMAHLVLAVVIVAGTVVHAVLIEGTMETVSKFVLCGVLLGATLFALLRLRGRAPIARGR